MRPARASPTAWSVLPVHTPLCWVSPPALNARWGWYQPIPQQPCVPCPNGTFENGVGATACQACGAGTFGNSSASLDCFDCPSGSYQHLTAQSSCLLCSPGQYNPQSRAQQCTLCPVGHFTPINGSTSCQLCLCLDQFSLYRVNLRVLSALWVPSVIRMG